MNAYRVSLSFGGFTRAAVRVTAEDIANYTIRGAGDTDERVAEYLARPKLRREANVTEEDIIAHGGMVRVVPCP